MINEINIVSSADQNLDGYQNVPIDQVKSITNGYVKNIICNCLDQLNYDNRNALFLELTQKMCVNGTLTIRFLNLNLIPNKITNGDITGQKFSSILGYTNSCWSENEFSDLIQRLGDCVIAKLFHEHIYTVVSLQRVK